MALFSECSLRCARKVLDTADIVREAILRQQPMAGPRFGRLRGSNLDRAALSQDNLGSSLRSVYVAHLCRIGGLGRTRCFATWSCLCCVSPTEAICWLCISHTNDGRWRGAFRLPSPRMVFGWTFTSRSRNERRVLSRLPSLRSDRLSTGCSQRLLDLVSYPARAVKQALQRIPC